MPAQPASAIPSEFFMDDHWEGWQHFILVAILGGATCWGSSFCKQGANLDVSAVGSHQSLLIFHEGLFGSSLNQQPFLLGC